MLLRTKNKMKLFLDIKDKKKISDNKFCPPHYIPHKLPFGKPIEDELCHIHEKKWRMVHHQFFCNYIGCQHYDFMMEKYDEFKKM